MTRARPRRYTEKKARGGDAVAKYKAYREMLNEKPILWSDRKRILGLPLSFTRYRVDEDRLYRDGKREIERLLG